MKKYLCYYHKTIFFNEVACYGKRINTECFDSEREAERYCNTHVGVQKLSDGSYHENEMKYEEVII